MGPRGNSIAFLQVWRSHELILGQGGIKIGFVHNMSGHNVILLATTHFLT